MPFAVVILVQLASRPAIAQSVQNRLSNDFGDLLRVLTDMASRITTSSRAEALSFFNRLELLNVESEIDRLVGSPWELSDSTSYKLSLAPQHLAYPVFDQMVRQMTRLDDIRSRRIQDLTVDSLGLIQVDLSTLDGERSGSQLTSAIVRYFNAREYVDLGVFLAAQQPYFPTTDQEWQYRKHQIAGHQGMLALGVAGLGALFEVGTLTNSGTISRCQDDACRIGWYGGFSHLGYHFRPNLRGGLTVTVPWLELSTGLMDQVRPSVGSASQVFEMAVRESWLNRYTTVGGWDSFVEAALRRVLSSEPNYTGEVFTSRAGLFVKRERPFHLQDITLRSSLEIESNLDSSLRYAFALGVDYTRTGLSLALQSSRTNPTDGKAFVAERRTGLFIAGTVESPVEYYVEAMETKARLLREQCLAFRQSEMERAKASAQMRLLATAQAETSGLAEVFEAMRKAMAEGEAHRMQMATMLADYLEARRIAYSLRQWYRSPDELYGPLDGDMLEAAGFAVSARLDELASLLRASLVKLEILRDHYYRTKENAQLSQKQDDMVQRDLDAIDRAWRNQSEVTTEALRLYNHYLACTRRITGLAQGLVPVRQLEPLSNRAVRRLTTLLAPPML